MEDEPAHDSKERPHEQEPEESSGELRYAEEVVASDDDAAKGSVDDESWLYGDKPATPATHVVVETARAYYDNYYGVGPRSKRTIRKRVGLPVASGDLNEI
jgi:hypothetical protein